MFCVLHRDYVRDGEPRAKVQGVRVVSEYLH